MYKAMQLCVLNRAIQARLEGESSFLVYGTLQSHGINPDDIDNCTIEEEVEDDLIYTVVSWKEGDSPFF